MGMKDLSAYERAQLSSEEIKTPSDLPAVPAGHFRVIYTTKDKQNQVPFMDVLLDSTVTIICEKLARKGDEVISISSKEQIDALKFWTAKGQKEYSNILAIQEGPGKRGRKPKADGTAEPEADAKVEADAKAATT